MTTLRVLRYAFLVGARDYAAIYTWKSWLAGWYVRVLTQVVFFALIGRLLDSEQVTWFLLVGNVAMLAAMQGVWALNMTTMERNVGALPVLVASPTSPVVVFVGRGAYLIVDGLASALGALFLAAPLFGLPLPWPRVLLVVPLLLLIASSAYCLGTFLGGVLMRARWMSTLTSNVTIVVLMVLCGVNVPLSAYPAPVRLVSQLLPLTHGLLAIRAVLAGDLATAAVQTGYEVLVGLGWLAACLLTFARFVGHGRRTGTLEFAA